MMTSDPAGSSEIKYKGVRKRKWGKWVSEVRLPHSRKRIWLGSYDSAEKSARAFDAATFCLRGRHAQLNFPDNPPPVPAGASSLTYQEIREIATRHAHSGTWEQETQTTAAVGAENSPVEAPMPDVNVEVNPPPPMDWYSFDLMNEGFSTIDELAYNFTAPVMTGPVDGEEEEEETGTCPPLWNF